MRFTPLRGPETSKLLTGATGQMRSANVRSDPRLSLASLRCKRLGIDFPVNQVTYPALKKSDPCRVMSRRGDDMDTNSRTYAGNTYILDNDVMEEMENLDATVVLPETPDQLDDSATQDDDFLEDYAAATVVLSDSPSLER